MQDSFNREATIVTSEHVKLQLQTAGLGSRAAAMLLDTLLMIAFYGIVSLTVGLVMAIAGSGLSDVFGSYAAAFLVILYFLLIGAYYALTEYFMGGQTFGKKWMGLRVVHENGQPLTFLSAIIRNFFRIIDFLPSFYLFGAIWMFFHPVDKRLGDVAAGTMVIHDKRNDRQRSRTRLKKWLDKQNRTLHAEYPIPHAGDRIGREDWLLLSGLVERMPSLDKLKREELAWHLAARLGYKLQIEGNAQMRDPEMFLLVLYEQLYEEWSI
ncbi:RDD family protein [Paenibacillus sp. NEAU-GSW1]|uniref:RDD family protein n=1 Tax=Paenibacillus sp. NEAU-GSW1 TaxID=2682486 RepID=UPI0012E28E5A|nr:RDD family protein [Paenibacillus sp. NEAU-GSW1]MUT64626.1 RDD family protein [Paenibacillus sp. NEAU-GSW1]